MQIRWPDLYIVGAAKCGTSSLAAYLAQHPQIGMSKRKEPNYFAFIGANLRKMCGPDCGDVLYKKLYFDSVTTPVEYLELFRDVSDRPVLAEASVRYLYSSTAASRIHEVAPQARIVILLRDPIARAWSHYSMMRYFYNLEPLGWKKALIAEQSRIDAGWDFDWHYLAVGCYATQVKRFIDLFGSNQVRIYWHSAFSRSPLEVIRDIYQFVNIDSTFTPDFSAREKSGFKLRSITLHKLLEEKTLLQRAIKLVLRSRHGNQINRLLKWNRVPLSPAPLGFSSRLAESVSQDRKKLTEVTGLKPPW